MSHNVQSPLRLSMNPVALSSYSVAVSSFAAAVLGLPISHWPSGALAGVGGFYLLVGLFSRKSSATLVNKNHDVSRQTAGADNLVAEAVGANQVTSPSTVRAGELVGVQR